MADPEAGQEASGSCPPESRLSRRDRESKPVSTKSSRRTEIEAAWTRISEHVENLRRLTGELAEMGETRASDGQAAADVVDRLSRHGAELRAAVAHLEGLGRSAMLAPPAPPGSQREELRSLQEDPELRRLVDAVGRRLRASRRTVPALEDALAGLARYVESVYGVTLDRR